MIRALTACLILFALSAHAALNETFVIITNAPTTNGMTFVVNGSTRTWSNAIVSSPSTLILTNSTIGGCATNLFTHVMGAKFSGIQATYSGTNGIKLQSVSTITASLTGNWGYVSNTSATTTAGDFVPYPLSNISSAATRTNIGSGVVNDLSTYSTNSFSMHSVLISNLMRLATNNNVTGSNTFSGTNLFSHYSNRFQGTFTGQIGSLSNGVIISPTIGGSPVSSNLVNYGSAISSRGSGTDAQAFGAGSTATGANGFAAGIGAEAQGSSSLALGYQSVASGSSSISAGANAAASGSSSISFGSDSSATALASMAFGEGAQATNINSIAFGVGAVTLTSNQIVLGSSTVQHIYSPGRIEAILGITNALFTGTNNFRGDVAYQVTNVTSLANGNNAAINFSGKIYSRISGPSAAFSINGIAGGRDGRILKLQNISGQSMTIAHDSGVDPTAANRILTSSGADLTIGSTNAIVNFTYDPTQSRWICEYASGVATNGLTALTNVGGGFAVFDSNAGSVAQLRTITAGSGVSVATNATNIVISGPTFNANQFASIGTTNIVDGVRLTNAHNQGTFTITNGSLISPVLGEITNATQVLTNARYVPIRNPVVDDLIVRVPTNAPVNFEQIYFMREDNGNIVVTNTLGLFVGASGSSTSLSLDVLSPMAWLVNAGTNWLVVLKPQYP